MSTNWSEGFDNENISLSYIAWLERRFFGYRILS